MSYKATSASFLSELSTSCEEGHTGIIPSKFGKNQYNEESVIRQRKTKTNGEQGGSNEYPQSMI